MNCFDYSDMESQSMSQLRTPRMPYQQLLAGIVGSKEALTMRCAAIFGPICTTIQADAQRSRLLLHRRNTFSPIRGEVVRRGNFETACSCLAMKLATLIFAHGQTCLKSSDNQCCRLSYPRACHHKTCRYSTQKEKPLLIRALPCIVAGAC